MRIKDILARHNVVKTPELTKDLVNWVITQKRADRAKFYSRLKKLKEILLSDLDLRSSSAISLSLKLNRFIEREQKYLQKMDG